MSQMTSYVTGKASRLGIKTKLCPWLALWPWTRCVISLGFNFPTCKTGIMMTLHSHSWCWGGNKSRSLREPYLKHGSSAVNICFPSINAKKFAKKYLNSLNWLTSNQIVTIFKFTSLKPSLSFPCGQNAVKSVSFDVTLPRVIHCGL